MYHRKKRKMSIARPSSEISYADPHALLSQVIGVRDESRHFSLHTLKGSVSSQSQKHPIEIASCPPS